MDGRDTIRAVGTDNSQIGHPNLAPSALVHQAHSLKASIISWKTLTNLMEQPAIHFIDNLQMPWKYDFEPRERPVFQRFGQQRVIGVCKGILCDRPSLVPSKTRLIKQNAHQLRDGPSRVSVIQVKRCLLRKSIPIRVAATESPHRICKRTGNQKVLLHKP